MIQTGGEILVRCLAAQGVRTVFGVPGESYLAVLDALHGSEIRYVGARHEGGASFMAEAWGKLTGQPGVCMVTRGPGATNAAIGVHTALQNSTPMLLLIGQVARSMRGREAFQEIDYAAMFGTVAKWVFEIDDASRIPEIMARAWATAISGRPGPVVLALPEDVLAEQVEAPAYARPIRPVRPGADPDQVAEAARRLDAAERPLILIGGGGWDREGPALAALPGFAGAARIPVVAGFRCQDLVDNNAPCFAGDAGVGMSPHVQRLIREADVILGINVRFGESMTNGYTLLTVPEPRQQVIHVHPSDRELGKIYQGGLMIQAGGDAFLAGLTARSMSAGDRRVVWFEQARADYEAGYDLPDQPGPLDMGVVMAHLNRVLPEDAILTNGAGNFAIWPSRLFRFGPKHRLLGPQSGAMGAGLPAAVAAKIARPESVVVCFAGDGDIQMTLAELGAALQAGAQPIVLVLNNASYGTIRMHQEREYPGRVSGTEIRNPDFQALAAAYGMHGEKVIETTEFAPAFDRAMASGSGAILELMIGVEAITPTKRLSAIRAAAMA